MKTRNDYSAVNSVMGRSSDWRDNTTHNGKACMRLSWELHGSKEELQRVLEQKRKALEAIPEVVGMSVGKLKSYGLRTIYVKFSPAA